MSGCVKFNQEIHAGPTTVHPLAIRDESVSPPIWQLSPPRVLFFPIKITGIQKMKGMPVELVKAGESAAFALQFPAVSKYEVKPDIFLFTKVLSSSQRKGSAMIARGLDRKASMEFEASIEIANHSITITVGYKATGNFALFITFLVCSYTLVITYLLFFTTLFHNS
jgi:hypothetical protein